METLENSPGVVSQAPKYYFGAAEVMYYLGCKQNKAYEVIRGMRKELIDAGLLYPGLPEGKIPKKYFMKRCMIED